MIVKIKDDEAAGVIRQHWIYTYYICPVDSFAFQMLFYVINGQFLIFTYLAVFTLNLIAVAAMTSVMPEISTLAIIAGSPGFLLN